MYRISSYSFRGNYSFLDLDIQRSQYINVRKLFKGGNYMRKYGMHFIFQGRGTKAKKISGRFTEDHKGWIW